MGVWTAGENAERIFRAVEVEFEGHMFPAPKCWDFYLTQLYGDYMQLPPENKRISHDFNVYMKENKE